MRQRLGCMGSSMAKDEGGARGDDVVGGTGGGSEWERGKSCVSFYEV